MAGPVKRTWALLRDLKGSQVENIVNLSCRTLQDRRPTAFTRGQTDLYSGSVETFSQSWFPASGPGFLLWKGQTKFERMEDHLSGLGQEASDPRPADPRLLFIPVFCCLSLLKYPLEVRTYFYTQTGSFH